MTSGADPNQGKKAQFPQALVLFAIKKIHINKRKTLLCIDEITFRHYAWMPYGNEQGGRVFQIVVDIALTCLLLWLFLRAIFWIKSRGAETEEANKEGGK